MSPNISTNYACQAKNTTKIRFEQQSAAGKGIKNASGPADMIYETFISNALQIHAGRQYLIYEYIRTG